MARDLPFLVLALTPLLTLGCLDDKEAEDDDGAHHGWEDDGLEPDIDVPGATVSLPRTALGERSAAVVTVTNRGEGDLRIADISVSGDPAFTIDAPAAPVLAPGGQLEITVQFRPDAVSEAAAELWIASNDPDEPEVAVPLSGWGDGPEAATTGTLDLGTAAPGCVTPGMLTVENVGTQDLTVTAATIDPPFSVVDRDLPVVVPPETAFGLVVHYSPSGVADVDEGTLRLETDAGEVSVTVTGRAEGADRIEDDFVAKERATDVLFAIDRSCSMSDDIVAVMSMMPDFTGRLDDRGLDWRVSVVVDDDGCIEGPDLFIDATFAAADVEAVTQRMINVGASYGSNTERAFSLMEAAANASVTGGCNAGLLRPTASLNLVGITDEPEQSPQPWDHYVSVFQALKADPSDVAMHAIAGAGACAASSTSRFDAAATATDGVVLDICDDMGSNLDALAAALASPDPAVYPLSGVPVPETIGVTVDGAGAAGWTYDDIGMQVVFDAGAVPTTGERVVVTYIEDACP